LANGMNLGPKQLVVAFEKCKQSPLGKHSFVLYEMDPPSGRTCSGLRRVRCVRT
jgi:hypothetical protein